MTQNVRKNSRYQFCMIPNNEMGEAYIKMLKTFLNKDRYYITVKGQHVDKEKVPNASTYFGATRKECKFLRVYINEKREITKNNFVDWKQDALRVAITILDSESKKVERYRV